MDIQKYFDVVISGGGPAGLCFAKGLSQLNLKVAVIEKQEAEFIACPIIDGRDIALTNLSRDILVDLGIWDHFHQKDISEIREAKVFNGSSSYFLGLGNSHSQGMAYIISNHLIRKAAYEVVMKDNNITLITGTSVEDIDLANDLALTRLSNGEVLECKLLIGADSRFSAMRKKAGISASMKDFGKTMMVCQMSHELPHNSIATECFLYGYTLAVLPLNGNRASVILTAKPAEIQNLMEMSEQQFGEFICDKFQNRLGKMQLDSKRYSYPLVAVYSDKFISRRFALVGDAAVGMHPVTAHGFNFGLKAQKTMVDEINKALRINGDIGSVQLLNNFQRIHKKATLPLYLATNKIVDLYTNDNPPAKLARNVLIHIANNMLPVKSFISSKLSENKNSERILPLPLHIGREFIRSRRRSS